MTFFSSVAEAADSTPEGRNRAVDALRAISILVVVFGHWLMAAVMVDRAGELVVGYTIERAAWTHPFTWIFQVMPVFFVVGGFANAMSWRSARRREETYATWLRNRLRRLVLPVVPLLVVWAVAGWAALRSGVEPEMLQIGSQAAMVPTWFLAAYVVIVTLAPLTLWFWERWGWATIMAGAAAAALVDFVAIGLGWSSVGFLNYVVVWVTVHQLGYAWVDGRLGGARSRLALAAAGFAVTTLLVWAGPYPVAMVGLDTAEVSNSFPPRVTLVSLGWMLGGLALAMERPLRRWLDRPRPWRVVVAVNAQIMTLYLWHLTAMVLVIGLSLTVGGWGLRAEPLGAGWWLGRLPWFTVLAMTTLLLALLFGRFERPRPDPRPAPPAWRPVLAVIGVCAGLGLMAADGIADAGGLNWFALSLPIAAVLAGGLGGARRYRARQHRAS